MERPLIIPLAALAAGITVAFSFPIHHGVCALTITLALISLLMSLRSGRHYQALTSIYIVFFCAGILDMGIYLYKAPPADHIVNYISAEKTVVEGIIKEGPVHHYDRQEFVLSTRKIIRKDSPPLTIHGDLLVSAPAKVEIHYGQAIRMSTRLRKPENFSNPGGFDYVSYLRFRGILVRGNVTDEGGIVVLRSGLGNPLRTIVESYRQHLKTLIKGHVPFPAAAILQASLLGDAKEIPREIQDMFNATATSHIIAISGFNIGMVAFFSFLAVQLLMKSFPTLLLRYDLLKTSTILAVIPVITYTFIAGAGVTVVRATLMILLFMLAVLMGKIKDMYNTIAFAALVILVISPYALLDISFQLSFVGLLSIIYITPRLLSLLPPPPTHPTLIQWFLGRLGAFVSVTTAASLGTMPLIIFHFNRISTISLAANIAVVPILGILAIPLGMAVVFLTPLSPTLSYPFLHAAGFLADLSVSIVAFFASLPHGSLCVPSPALWVTALMYAAILSVVRLMDFRASPFGKIRGVYLSLGIVSLSLITAYYLTVYYTKESDGLMTVTAIDVGQGSSVLIETPQGGAILIDGGGFYDDRFDVGRYVVAPFLCHRKISAFDAVILSHPHPDHFAGLTYIMEHFDVHAFWTNGDKSAAEPFARLMETLGRKGIPVRLIDAGSPVAEIGGLSLRILNPSSPRSNEDINDASIVVDLRYGGQNVLVCGDISASVEACIIKAHPDLRADVLVVPHHGSRHGSSEAFLDTVKPKIAVVTVGKTNIFGLPHTETIERLAKRGIKVLRTDLHGAITIKMDGGTFIDVSHFRLP